MIKFKQHSLTYQVEILSYNYEQSTIFYQIKVKSKEKQWIISKRYSQFEELNKVLELRFKPLPPLPKKTFVSIFVGKSIEQINERKYGLEKYLQSLVQRKEILDTEILQLFLKLKPSDKLIKEELFKENIIEEVHISTSDQRIQEPLIEKVTQEKVNGFERKNLFITKDQETQTSSLQEILITENPSLKQLQEKVEDDGLSEQQNQQLFQEQLQELLQQLTDKNQQISEFDKKIEDTQSYYNGQIYEKQFQINELQAQLSHIQEQYTVLQQNCQNQSIQIEEFINAKQQNSELIAQLQGKVSEQQIQLEKLAVQIGFVDRFGQLDLSQEQQLIIDQQNMIELQMEKNNENESHLRIELEKHYQVENHRDELFEENNQLKTQYEEETLLRQQQNEELEQLKLQNEYLQMQLNEKQELLLMRDQLNEYQ